MLTIITAAATSDLTTLARVQAELPDAGDAPNLAKLIREASGAVTRYCGRETFGREVYLQTERVTRARGTLILDRDIRPDITAVTADGTVLAADAWERDGSLLYRLSGDRRAPWRGVVTVAYSAGYLLTTDMPDDLERCVVDLVVLYHTGRGRDPALRSEQILDVIQTSWIDPDKLHGPGGLPAYMEARLAPYVLTPL